MNKLLAAVLFFLPVSIQAQQKFSAIPVDSRTTTSLNTHFTSYALFQMSTSEIKQYAKRQNGGAIDFELHMPGYTSWDLSIHENDILSPDYFLTVSSAQGTVTLPKPECMTYTGYVKGSSASRVSLTITDDLVYGMVRSNGREYFIEPMHYLSRGASPDIYVIYETKDVINDPSITCGVTEMKSEHAKLSPPPPVENAGLNCVQNQIAIASDESMFLRYGSAAAVQAHNIGVINNVMWDYVNAQFNNNIEMVILTQHVSTSAAADQLTPAYTGVDAGIILNNFRTWANAGGFGTTAFDNGEFWTTRNIAGTGGPGTVGLAYVGVICTASRYHILEDFAGSIPTGSGYQLRVLTSHEMGHNFDCSHDAAGSPFIMAPTVQNTSIWSAASIASADAHVGSRACLGQCVTAGIPVADFIATPEGVCTGGTIQFIDQTLHGPTSWSWTFTGGAPGTATSRNPSATFATSGLKNIALTATNAAGSNTTGKLVLVSNAPAVACANTGSGTSNAGLYSFNLANINNVTDGLAVDGNEYMDFSCAQTTMLLPNATYTVTADVGTSVPSNEFNLVQFYIDYNNDGDFLDANEFIHSSPSCYIGEYSFTFTTPALPPVLNQFLRARVIAKDCFGGVNACYNVTLGQVEDYAVFFPDAVLLSVSLLRFDGYHQNGSNVLNWETTTEVNHKHFELERSIDGITYQKIATVNGSGPSASVNRYGYTDGLQNTRGYSTYYYRLKIVDNNGVFRYSNVVVLKTDLNSGITIYPNPLKRGELLQVGLQNRQAEKIEILNPIGQVLYTKQLQSIWGTVSIPTSAAWATGIYVVRIFDGKKAITQKIVIQ